MNFIGVGPLELILVLVIGVVILGPDRIPEVAVQVARAVRSLRGYATNATADIRAELNELTKEYDEVRKELQEFRQSVARDMTSITEEVDRTLKESRAIVEPGGEPPPDRGRAPGPRSGQA